MTVSVNSQSLLVFLPIKPEEKHSQLCSYGQYFDQVIKPQDVILIDEEEVYELSRHKVECYANKAVQSEYQTLIQRISDAQIQLQTRPGSLPASLQQKQRELYLEAFNFIYGLVKDQQDHLTGFSEIKENLLPWETIKQAIENKQNIRDQESLFIDLCDSLITFFYQESAFKQIPSLISRIQSISASKIFVVAPQQILTEDFLNQLQRPYKIENKRDSSSQPSDKLHHSQGF